MTAKKREYTAATEHALFEESIDHALINMKIDGASEEECRDFLRLMAATIDRWMLELPATWPALLEGTVHEAKQLGVDWWTFNQNRD